MSEPTTVHGEPPEGHCCLATMEDITKEDKNYGKRPIVFFMFVCFCLVLL